MLTNAEVVCFAASYGVALALEASRLLFRAPVRWIVMSLFAAVGLALHADFLARLAWNADGVAPLSSWRQWCLVAAWLVAAVYLWASVARPETTYGLFLLPMVLLLIGLSYLASDQPFPREQALAIWGAAHGIALLLGTVVTSLGFVAGVMYLIQSYRLKHKLPPRLGLKLPTLEWLQAANKQALVVSSFLVAVGLVAGVVLNAIRHAKAGAALPWSDPVVVTSSALLAWLVAATLFEALYKPAQQGRKVAYLTIASFVFVVAAVAMTLASGSQHAAPKAAGSIAVPSAARAAT